MSSLKDEVVLIRAELTSKLFGFPIWMDLLAAVLLGFAAGKLF